MTAVLAWRPHYKSQKPLSCSVQSLEIFSCNLSCEDETALSIIDPMAGLIELNASERLHKRKTQGLLDATLESLPSLEVWQISSNCETPQTIRLPIFRQVSKTPYFDQCFDIHGTDMQPDRLMIAVHPLYSVCACPVSNFNA